MRVIIIIISLFISFISISQVNFTSDLNDVFKEAEESNKLILVVYHNSECPVCQDLENYFEMEEMGDFYNKYFVNYKLNTLEMKETEEQLIDEANLAIKAVPIFLFFNTDRELVHYSSIQRDLERLLSIGKTALNSLARTSSLAPKYEDGDRSIRNLYAYCRLLDLYENDSLITEVAQELYKAFPKKNRTTKKAYIVTKTCVNHIDNGFFKTWIENLETMQTHAPEGSEEHKKILQDILTKVLYSDEPNYWGLDKINQVKNYIEVTHLSEDPNVFLWEHEIRALLDENKEKEAQNLFKNRISKSTTMESEIYIFEKSMTLFHTKESLQIVKNELDNLTPETDYQKDKFEYLETLYIHKVNQVNEE